MVAATRTFSPVTFQYRGFESCIITAYTQRIARQIVLRVNDILLMALSGQNFTVPVTCNHDAARIFSVEKANLSQCLRLKVSSRNREKNDGKKEEEKKQKVLRGEQYKRIKARMRGIRTSRRTGSTDKRNE